MWTIKSHNYEKAPSFSQALEHKCIMCGEIVPAWEGRYDKYNLWICSSCEGASQEAEVRIAKALENLK